MASIMTGSVDVTKITKSKIAKGKYLPLTFVSNDEVGQYGDKNYLGNGKEFVFSSNGGAQSMATATVDDDLPF